MTNYRHSTSYQVILKIVKNTCDNSVQKCVNINLYITMSISILSGRRMFHNLIIKICSKPSITQYKLKALNQNLLQLLSKSTFIITMLKKPNQIMFTVKPVLVANSIM